MCAVHQLYFFKGHGWFTSGKGDPRAAVLFCFYTTDVEVVDSSLKENSTVNILKIRTVKS